MDPSCAAGADSGPLAGSPSAAGDWPARLRALADLIRSATRRALLDAQASGSARELARPHGQGVGDVTFGLDVPSEAILSRFLVETARREPLSLLTEDSGWRHMGPGPRGEPVPRAGFDHGGVRIAVDPIDGTRNLMADLRAAWTVLALAPPGRGEPRLCDASFGLLSEIPGSLAARYRVLCADARGCALELRELEGGALVDARALRVDGDARVDHGYFPIFRYEPHQRPLIARLEADLFARLAQSEGADLRTCWDDQYISNAGQLALLALGTYRMIADLRAELARRCGERVVTTKPYDVSAAIVCARAAGCVVTSADGGELDFPLDAATPVSFVGYANEATRARIEPHLQAALRALDPARDG